MALLSNNSHIVPSVMIDLTFDGGIKKNFEVKVRDIICVTYNNNGLATTIQGKVISINTAGTPFNYAASPVANYDTTYCTNKNGPYFVIDGSDTYAGKTATIYLGTILDCDMISKWSDNYVVTTPPADTSADINSIDMIRLHEGNVEYTINNGESWNLIVGVTSDNLESALNALKEELKAYVDSKI